MEYIRHGRYPYWLALAVLHFLRRMLHCLQTAHVCTAENTIQINDIDRTEGASVYLKLSRSVKLNWLPVLKIDLHIRNTIIFLRQILGWAVVFEAWKGHNCWLNDFGKNLSITFTTIVSHFFDRRIHAEREIGERSMAWFKKLTKACSLTFSSILHGVPLAVWISTVSFAQP